MKTLHYSSRVLTRVWSLVLLALLLLVACQPAAEPVAAPAEMRQEEATADDPVTVVSAFYEWYLTYNNPEQGRNALVDYAYRESEYLSANWINTVDAQLEQMRSEAGGAGFDPFLMAQDLPQAITVEAWEVGAEQAQVIVHEQFGGNMRDLTADLVLEEDGWKIDQIHAASPATPEGVAELFLSEYLEQARASLEAGEPGMLQSGAYREHELLSPAFVAQVDAILAKGDRAPYDPFILAQDLPHAIAIGEPVVTGDTAEVEVGRYYAGTAEASPIIVELAQQGGRWLISNIRPVEMAVEESEAPAMEPQAVVEAFYAEWRELVGSAMAAGGESPLAGHAYHESPFLTEALMAKVDGIVAGFEQGGYDPFLCAQDLPTEIGVDGVIYTLSGARAALHTDFANHAFAVALEQSADGSWQISDVVCQGTPQSNAAIFYTWYLAYTRNCCVLGATDPYEQRSPLVDGAYKEAPYMNPAFAAEVEAELEQMGANGGSGYDPILQAQAFPPDFAVEAGESEGVVIVDMAFANEHRLQVEMELVEGQWLVSAVTRLEATEPVALAATLPDTSEWTTVSDAEYGFSFQIPAVWVAQEQSMQGPGMPEDWPVLRQYLVMPASVAEELAAQSGPPSGDEMLPVPPFTVSFLHGDQAAFDRAYVAAAYEDIIQLNSREIRSQRQEGMYGMPRYIFQDGQDAQRWLIVEDMVNEFPGREVQAAEVFGVLDGILASVSLDD